MKLDKAALAKNHFWILLGLSMVLLIVFFFVLRGTAGEAEKAKKYYTGQEGKVKNPGKIVNAGTFNPAWERRKKEYQVVKKNVWEKLWNEQNDPERFPYPLMTWPKDQSVTQGAQRLLEEKAVFGDNTLLELKDVNGNPITAQTYLREYRDRLYRTQFPDEEAMKSVYPSSFALSEILYPKGTTDRVNFPVAFRGGLGAVMQQEDWSNKEAMSTEEIWLAQEDLWIRRELLMALKKTLDRLAHCKPVINPDTKTNDWPKEVPVEKQMSGAFVRKFRNRNWEVALLIERNEANQWVVGENSTIKNVNPDQQAQHLVHRGAGLVLQARQGGLIKNLKPIVGVLLPPGGQTTFKVSTSTTQIDFNKPFEVYEIYTYDTSPIKSVLKMEVGTQKAQSHRTFVMKLQRGRMSPAIETTPSAGAGAAGGMGGAPPGGGGEGGYGAPPPGGGGEGGFGAPPPGGGGFGGLGTGGEEGFGQTRNTVTGDKNAPTTVNGLSRDRYLVVNGQVRRPPLALGIVVEQPFKEEVMASVAESRLNVQLTQVHWRRVGSALPGTTNPGSAPSGYGGLGGEPGEGGEPEAPTGEPGEGGETGAPPGYPTGGAGGGNTGAPPGYPTGGAGGDTTGQTQAQAAGDSGESNLVELAVYGVATIYERYSEPKEPAAPGVVGPGGTPPAGGP